MKFETGNNQMWDESELEAALKRAFVDNSLKSIGIDGHDVRFNKFRVDGINYGLDKGWLNYMGDEEDSQWTVMVYELSNKGKKHFGL